MLSIGVKVIKNFVLNTFVFITERPLIHFQDDEAATLIISVAICVIIYQGSGLGLYENVDISRINCVYSQPSIIAKKYRIIRCQTVLTILLDCLDLQWKEFRLARAQNRISTVFSTFCIKN